MSHPTHPGQPGHVTRRPSPARVAAGALLHLGLALLLASSSVLALGLPGATPALAATLTVCPSGPPTCGFAHIQGAVNAAAPGDTISVAPGTYDEHVTIPLNVTLTGVGQTITDGVPSSR